MKTRDNPARFMTVSFVIPTRNQAAFIKRCIDSCLEQRLPDAEILVIDGLSTDGTQEILASYGARVRWLSEKDGGQSDAVNRGVTMARGDVIAWINSDDYYAGPEVLARVVPYFEADAELDIVHGDGVMVDLAGLPIRAYPSRPLSVKSLLLNPASPLSQPAVFFRRSLFLDVGGLDRSLHFTMDYDLWIRMWQRARRTRYVPQTWAKATYHADAKSVRNMRQQIRETIALKRRYAPDLDLGLADWLRLGAGVASLYVYWAATRVGLHRAT
jgi:glycosyltransferase involved in cell wall biosynthesis